MIIFYSLRCWRLIKKRGLDPALITYASPLSMKNFLVGRLILCAAVLLLLANDWSGRLAFSFILIAALAQLILLFSFGRQHTQPYLYYLVLVLLSMLALIIGRSPLVWGSLIILVIILELYLRSWRKGSEWSYNHWVASQTMKIYATYKNLFTEMEKDCRRWTLHVAVTEHIARPAIVRLAERIYFLIKQPAVISTGIMQVASSKPLSDRQSLELGASIIKKALASMPKALDEQGKLLWMSRHYNGSLAYSTYLIATNSGFTLAWDEISQNNRGR